MNNSSKSTVLLNCLVALATKTPDFPSPLYEHGFQLENIEPSILLADGKQAKPDIQFKKNNNHITFFECKDGYCTKEQLDRYKQMTVEDIARNHITCLPRQNLSFDLAYFCTKKKENKLISSVQRDGNTFPIIILEKNRISRNGSSSSFHNDELNQIFSEIRFETPIPQSFIPFTVDDDDKMITIALLQHLITKSNSTFTINELVKALFSHVINHYSREGSEALKSRIGRLMSYLSRSDDFSEYIAINGQNYTIKSTTTLKFRNACKRLVEGYHEEQERAKNSLMPYLSDNDVS